MSDVSFVELQVIMVQIEASQTVHFRNEPWNVLDLVVLQVETFQVFATSDAPRDALEVFVLQRDGFDIVASRKTGVLHLARCQQSGD